MARQPLEPLSTLKRRLEQNYARGFDATFWFWGGLWFVLIVIPLIISWGTMFGLITEPSWITQRWPYPKP